MRAVDVPLDEESKTDLYERGFEDGRMGWIPPQPERAELEGVFPKLKFFAFEHLPEKLQAHSRPFAELAFRVAKECRDRDEAKVSIRKLLEAKDAAVRAAL